MSAFSDHLGGKSIHGLPCSVAEALDQMDADSRADANEALSTRAVSAANIYAAFVRLGYDVGAQSIRRHRNGECRCKVRMLP